MDSNSVPMVSIIIPFYNSQACLRRCIDSVVAQTYKKIEIILVDDGSIDYSRSVCCEYLPDEKIVYFYQQNSGVSSARNKGIDLSRGEYITFLDSDDTIEPDFIRNIIVNMMASDADVGLCDIYYIETNTEVKSISKIRFKESVSIISHAKDLVNKMRTFVWGKIYRRKIFEELRFPSINFAEDIPVSTMATMISRRVVYIPLPLYSYYRSQTSSLSSNEVRISDLLIALKILYQQMREAHFWEIYKIEYKKIMVAQIRFAYRKFGEFSNYAETLEFAIKKFPELRGFSDLCFAAYGDDGVLVMALDKALIRKEQIERDLDKADCVVAYADSVNVFRNKFVIKVNRQDPKMTDVISVSYDLAEQIIEKYRFKER